LHPGSEVDLRTWFNATLRPKLLAHLDIGERSERTLEEYDAALAHWEQKAVVDGKRNPAVGLISETVVIEFRRRLLKEPYFKGKGDKKRSRTNQTVNKVMRHLRAIIRTLFAKDSHNPNGAGLIELFAWPEELKRQGRFVFTFDRKQLSALYLATRSCKSDSKFASAKSPMHCAAKWRTALALALNSGPRSWDLFGLPWSAIHWDKFRYGAVWFQARKNAKVQMIPLNKVCRIHLEHLRSLYPDEEFIFQGFQKDSTFYRCWERISSAAGVPKAPFERMRKTCSTLHDDICFGVGAFLLGHSPHGVNATWYDNPTPRVMRTVYQLKCPAEFRRGAKQLAQSKRSSGTQSS